MKNYKTPVALWRVQIDSAIYSLNMIAESIPKSTSRKRMPVKVTAKLESLRPILPYCLHPAGETNFILLNRDYLPIGNTRQEFVKYANYTWAHVPPPPHALLRDGRIYFYGYDRIPWWVNRSMLARYIDRLHRFLYDDWTLLDKPF